MLGTDFCSWTVLGVSGALFFVAGLCTLSGFDSRIFVTGVVGRTSFDCALEFVIGSCVCEVDFPVTEDDILGLSDSGRLIDVLLGRVWDGVLEMAISPTFDSDVVALLVFLSLDQNTQPADFEPSPGSCGGGAASSEDAVDGASGVGIGSATWRLILAVFAGSSATLLLAL